ncbi:MAG: inner membrane-spanning protein YciB [Oligoflexales bacterium]
MDKAKIVKYLEFLPFICFAAVGFKLLDLYTGTIFVMASSVLFVSVAKALGQPVTKFQLGTSIALIFFSSLTLLFRDEMFIKLKTTVFNFIVASIFALSHVLGEKTIIERLIGSRIKAPKQMLRNLNGAAVFYFVGIACLNLWVTYNLSSEDWAKFKVFGIFLINTVCFGGGLYYLKDYLKEFLDQMEKK